jgi:hypothetical protein
VSFAGHGKGGELNVKTHKRVIAVAVTALGIVAAFGGWALASGTNAPASPTTPAVTQPKTAPDIGTEVEGPASETESEKPGVEEPGDSNLPGGGHADPAGDVQHEFEGEE